MAPRQRARVLTLIVVLGALLRVVPIWFGLPFDRARPDEETAIGHAVAILAGDRNPHFFHWPSFSFYAFAGSFATASWLHRLAGIDPALSANEQYLIARGVGALAGTLTIAVLFALAAEVADEQTALIAAWFLAIAPLHVRESHFAMTDVPATFFTTVSLTCVLRATRGTAWSFAAAGLAGGLAASTKYTGAIVVTALAAAVYVRTRHSPNWQWKPDVWTPVLSFAGAFAAGFLIGTPYAVLDWRSFANGVAFDVTHLSTGHAFLDLGPGWTYHLERSLPYGLGVPVFIAAVVGTIFLARSHRRPAVVIGSFCFALYACLGPGRTVFFRYVLPIVPLACVSAAVALRRARTLTLALTLVVGLPSFVSSAWLDALLARADSRVLAGRWLGTQVGAEETLYDAGGVYAGVSVLGVPGHHWSAETFDPVQRVFRDSDGRLPDWLVLPDSPLVYGNVPPELRTLAADRYALAHVVRATLPGPTRGVYDLQDAFFLPIAGFRGVLRPGPTVSIFRRITR